MNEGKGKQTKIGQAAVKLGPHVWIKGGEGPMGQNRPGPSYRYY
jgi:hypothetical protein